MSTTDSRDQLVDAALSVLAESGLHGFTLRAVSTRADCALGLVNYHFADKNSLVIEAYQQIVDRLSEASDRAVAAADDDEAKLIAFIETVFDPAFLNTDYLTLRLSLWAAAGSDDLIAELNTRFDRDYLLRLTELLSAARPELIDDEAQARAADIMVAQNGVWLSWAVRPDHAALDRCLKHCHDLALRH